MFCRTAGDGTGTLFDTPAQVNRLLAAEIEKASNVYRKIWNIGNELSIYYRDSS